MNKLKKLGKAILPSKIRSKIKVFLMLRFNYHYDFKRYKKYSGTTNIYKSKKTLEGMIIHTYHSLEKGMSLKNARKGFGEDKARHLISMIKDYKENYNFDETTETALNTLDAYYEFQKDVGINYSFVKAEVDRIREDITTTFTNEGGYKYVNRADIFKYSKINFKEFAYNRFSIRTYESKEVDNSYIKEAVKIAQKTPTVCNRQSSKVYVFSDKESKEKILSWQNGNKGFGHEASKVILITSDLSLFHGTIERNQAFIDGGLFSMSLLYALHSLGLGACSLNCSMDYHKDLELRKAAGIHNSETIIMMISVGWIPEKVKVAQSHIRNTDEMVIFS